LRSLDDYELDDHCDLIPGIFRYANNHELLALVAPRPVLIVQSSSDESCPIKGARTVYEYGTEIYTTLHERKGIAFVEDDSNGRGFQKAKREAAYGWFLQWLATTGNGKPVEEPDTEVEPADAPELAVLPEGRTAPAEPGITALVAGLVNDAALRTEEFRPNVLLDEQPPRAPCRWRGRIGHLNRDAYFTQRNITIPTLQMRPGLIGASPANGELVPIDDRGKEYLVSDPIVREAIEKRGWRVRLVDPR